MNPDRPLDGVRSIKVKLGLLVATSIVVAVLVSEIGDRADVSVAVTGAVTLAVALAATQWLARGMTSPLREMTAAASAMATGDYSRRVTATSEDEVGRLAKAFNTMAADLSTADQQRRQLVATVSHELRTPLTAQQALLENLVDGVVRPDDEVLRAALAQAERLGALVHDLLDLSRLDGGGVPLDLAPVTVTDVLERAVAEAAVAGRRVRHAVHVEPAELVVTADAARLAQLLANLLDNADRNSPSGGSVTVSAGESGPDRWWLEVRDEGPGIDPRDAVRVFDRFGSGADAGGGTGIGLAIASWVCALHGGSITALPVGTGASGARLRAVLPRAPQPSLATVAATPGSSESTDTCVRQTAQEDRVTSAPTRPEAPASYESRTATPAGPTTSERPEPIVASVFGALWPESALRPQVGLVLGSLVVGVLAGAVLPYRNIGVALLLVLVAGGALVLRASVRRRQPWTVMSAVVCLGLASLTVIRAAEWLTVLAIAAGIVVTTTALTGARGFIPLVASTLGWPLAALRGLPLLGRTTTAMSRVSFLWPALRTAAISLVALVAFGGLFASGDAIFGSWVAAVVPDFAWDGLILRTFVGFVAGGAVLAACYLALNPARAERLATGPGRPVARVWEWLVPVALVVGPFLAFVVAQGAALWAGPDFVERSTGLTYAESVHQGFGQLTAVTLLTLVTVAIAARKAPRSTPRDRLVLRMMLGVLCVLALVVVASALYRMNVYQQAYGFTVLRVLVDVFELWMGLLLVLVLLAGVQLRGSWLPRAALVSGAFLVIVLGLANPEGWVAQQNIDRYHETGKLDLYYLSSLGADATPAIWNGLPAGLAACVTPTRSDEEPDDLLGWNLGRSRARSVLAEHAQLPAGDPCGEILDEFARGQS